jgi:hypothetical protein
MKTLALIATVLLFACKKEDTALKTGNISKQTTDTLTTDTSTTEFLGFDSYGQSLSIGGDAGKLAYVVSTTQKYNSVMPNLGVRSLDYPKQKATSFVPLIEQLSTSGTFGETLVSGACEMFAQSYPDRPFILHGVASGTGGQTVLQLSKGSSNYTRLTNDMQSAYSTAEGMGDTFSLGSTGYTQGEADITAGTDYDDYRQELVQLHDDINVDIPAITGQTNSIPFIVGQVSSINRTSASKANPEIALAQLDLCINDSGFTLATPMYMFDYLSDNTHFDGLHYRMLAAYYGYAAKKLLIDGVKNFIYVQESSVVTNDIYLTFNVPVAPLVFDTIQVVNPGNYGFTVKNSSGKNIKLKLVEILGDDTVHIKCASSPSGGQLSYAINGQSKRAGRTSGPRGCLRDSQGNTIIFDPEGTNYPLNNWTPIFRIQL